MTKNLNRFLRNVPVSIAGAFLLALGSAVARADTFLDNGSSAFTTIGTWPTSTSVTGYYGSNYQVHAAMGDPVGTIIVDNQDAGFAVTGTWPTSTAVSGYLGANYQVHAANGDPPGTLIVDNGSGSATGTWPSSTSISGYYGTDYQTHAAGTGANSFTWALGVPQTGSYQVYARWSAATNRADNAVYTVTHASGTTSVSVNQKGSGGQWNLLGTFNLDPSLSPHVTLTDAADGYVVADAIRVVPVGAAPNTATWTVSIPSAASYRVYARWTAHPNRATNAVYTVNSTSGATNVSVNQQQSVATWNLLGTYSFNAGSATVSLTDEANGYVIADAIRFVPDASPPNTAIWTPPTPGRYDVYARWTAYPNRASDAKYTVKHRDGSTQITVNQQINSAQWNLLGTFTFQNSGHNISLTDDANGYVIADAIRLVSVPDGLTGYYIETDQLNTPRAISNQTQQVVWRWDNDEAFGANAPNENPSSLGSFTYNPRFPGQYFDKETSNHYNYFRDYSPDIGRYVESDPIGITAGLNTYGYVLANPIGAKDPSGLVKWSGTLFSIGVGPISYDTYTLTSECKCGFQYSVRVVGRGLGVLGKGFNFAGSFVSFDDYLPCPDADILAGDYFSNSGGVAGIFGYGFSTTILGGAHSPGEWGAQYGLGANAGSTIGKSSIVYKFRIPCSCSLAAK